MANEIPETGCYVCHADPVTGNMTGSVYGGIKTPSCDECHEMRPNWAPNVLIEVTPNPTADPAGADFEAVTGQAVTLDAAITVPGTNTAYTGNIVYQFSFGDGSAPSPLVEVKSNGHVEVEHFYAQMGTYEGYVSVTAEGMTLPTVVPFTVKVTDPDIVEPEPYWAVTETDGLGNVQTFDITFQVAPGTNGDGLTGTKTQNGEVSVAVGSRLGNVIFWIDMEFSLGTWGIGTTYFGNVQQVENRDGTFSDVSMSGIVISPLGDIGTFTAEAE